MTNLTFERLVRLAPDLNPVVGHDLVIFEKIGAGKKLVGIVKADEQYQENKWKRWIARLSGGPSFVAYAVNMDENLVLDFPRRIQPDGNSKTKPFDLEFKVRYQVSSSETLVRRLLATTDKDPLTRLQDAIHESVSDILGVISWDMIWERFDEVRRDIVPEALEKVEGISAHLGLTVKHLNLSRRPLQDVIDLQKTLEEIEGKTIIETKKNEGQTIIETKKNEGEISLIEQRSRLARAAAGLRVLDDGVGAFNEALKNVGIDIHTIDDLIEALEKLGLRNPMGLDSKFPAIAPPARGPITDYLPDWAGRLKDLLTSTVDCVNQIDCAIDQRKALVVAILHIAAELIAGDGTALEKAVPFGEKLKDTMSELRHGGLPEEQFERLFKFLNYAAIQELLR